MTAPPIDTRDADAVRRELAAALEAAGLPSDSVPGQTDEISAALIGVFSHFCETVIQRLNRAPDKNLLAFLDLIGVSRLPPQPARVPLSFTLGSTAPADALVPAGTRAAAPPAEGAKDPVVFETERDLSVVPVQVQTLIAVQPERDTLADHRTLLEAGASASGVLMFAGNRANEHILYVGDSAFGASNLSEMRVNIRQRTPPVPETSDLFSSELIWEAWDGSAWQRIPSADVISQPPLFHGVYSFRRQQSVPESTIAGLRSNWLRVRPASKPVSPSPTPVAGMLCAGRLPELIGVDSSALLARDQFEPEAVVFNDQRIDTTKPFHVFGEQPRYGDALYIASRAAFERRGTAVTLSLPVFNPTVGSDPPLLPVPPPVLASQDLLLVWEIGTAAGWMKIGESRRTGSLPGAVTDNTNAFTSAANPTVSLTVPAGIVPALRTVDGIESYWFRVRIGEGNYGFPARYVPIDGNPANGFRLIPDTFRPPIVNSIRVSSSVQTPSLPGKVVSSNHGEEDDLTAVLAAPDDGSPVLGARPFRPIPAERSALYMGFALPAGRSAFPNRTISLYHGLVAQAYRDRQIPLDTVASVMNATPGSQANHRFIVTNPSDVPATYSFAVMGTTWAFVLAQPPMPLAPGSSAIVTVTVIVPPATSLPSGKVSDAGFLRISTPNGSISSSSFETRLAGSRARQRSVLWQYWNGASWTALAAVDGTSALTQSGVIDFLAPRDLVRGQHFGVEAYWVRALFERGDEGMEPRLRVLVPNTVWATQTDTLRDEVLGSSNATENQRFRTQSSPVLASPELDVREAENLWVRWSEAPDLHASGPEDRHYVFDHMMGEVTFGNGVRGRIPPRGAGNIRMTRYQIGGGSAGNVDAGKVVQLKTTVPFIDKVSNIDASTGGSAAETDAALISRAPRVLRHGGRAVAADDYADLARLASPDVARARCVPLRQLQFDPTGTAAVPGVVSVIIVPATVDPKPRPSIQLLERVQRFLDACDSATADVVVVGPLYVRVDVALEVALSRPDSVVLAERAIRERLSAFLHPLTGGRDGRGWDFGREPHASDVLALISDVPNIRYVRNVRLTQVEEVEGARQSGRFLVYSGLHQLDFTFPGTVQS